MAFDHLEIWDDLEAAGGVRLSTVPDLLALTDTRSLRRDDTLGFAMPVSSPAASDLVENGVMRVVHTDESVEEWLIAKFAESRSPAGLIIKGTANHISSRMLAALVSRTEVDGLVILDFEGINLTATDQWNAFIEPALTDAGITYFTLGTVDPTLRFDLLYEWDTPLSALGKLATALDVEIQFRRNGAVDYKVDILTAIGASATTVDMRIGSKLKGLKRTRSTVEQSTRVYPRGEETDGFHADMGRARWRILAFTATTIDLEDAAGGLGPIEFDDQLNTYHLIRVSDDNDFGAITDSAVTDQRLTFASTAGAAVGDICEVFETATKRLVFLESPADKVTYGLKSAVIDRPDVSGTINLAPNPALANFTGGNPDNWSAVLTPTLTQVTATDKWRVGGNSVRVQTNADGEGIETDYVTITPSTVQPFFSGFISFLLAVGKIRVELVATDGSATFIFPDPAVDKKATSNQINVWTDLGVEGINLQEKSVIQVKIRVLQDGTGTADFHVDLAQITQTAEQLSFMAGAGPTVLWQEANLQLRAHGVPGIRYDIDTMDLSRFDPVTWPDADHAPVLGGKVRVTDAELSIVGTTTRILEQSRNLREDLNTKLVLSSRPEDLSDALVRSRTKRKKRKADPPEFIDLKALTILHVKHRSLGGKVTFMYIGGVDVSSIRFATSTTGFPDPSAGTIVEGQFGRAVPAGTFVFADIVYITIRPFDGAGATGSTGPDFDFRVELEAREDQTADTDGRRKRLAEFTDGKKAVAADDVLGEVISEPVKDVASRKVSIMYAKATAGAVDTANSIINGTILRVTTINEKTGGGRGFSAIDSGNVLVAAAADFTRAYTNKHLGNVPDDVGSDRRAATADQKTGGDRGFGVLASASLIKNTSGIQDTSGDFVPNRHNEKAQSQEGDVINFASNYEGTPQVAFIPQTARVFVSGQSANDQSIDMKAISPSSSGFTQRAKILIGTTSVAITDGFSPAQNTAAPENGDVTLFDVVLPDSPRFFAYSNLEDANTNLTTYTIFFDVDIIDVNVIGVTVKLWYNDGASSTVWTLGDSRFYLQGANLTNEQLSVAVALGANFDLRIEAVPSKPEKPLWRVIAHGEDNAQPGVEYDKVTGGSEFSMTPNAGDKVEWSGMEAL